MKKQLFCIAGPTAVGKSDLAFRLAQHFSLPILSFDSRQCFQEMSIGTSKPSTEELKAVPHYFVNSHTLKEEVNAHTFEQYALQYIESHPSPVWIVVGGTGLYLQALCEGLSQTGEIEAEVKTHWENEWAEKGVDFLANELKKIDEDYFHQVDKKNPHRLLRALTLFHSTGEKMSELPKKKKAKERPFEVHKFLLSMEREDLYQKINLRVEKMLDAGLMEEALSLQMYQHLRPLQSIGYQEFYDWKRGKYKNLEECVEKIKQHTRNYAKRQITWFKRDTEMLHISREEESKVFDEIDKILSV